MLSSSACATEVSWYSSRRTTRYFVALQPTDLRLGAGELGRQRDLVGEVHQAELRLERAIALDQVEHLLALGHLRHGLARCRPWPADVASAASNSGRASRMERPHLVDRDQVLVQLGIEAEQVVDGRLRVLAEQVDRTRVALDRPGGHLVAGGVGHHPGVGLVADAQAVLGEERGGVGVVGHHHRLDPLGQLVARLPRPARRAPRPDRPRPVPPGPGTQLGGGLGGERQPEHLVGLDLPGGHEVDHARGHHRGLARARSGDHHGRLQRRADRGPLLVTDRVARAHQPLEVGRAVETDRCCAIGGGHDSTDPATWAGQKVANWQRSQRAAPAGRGTPRPAQRARPASAARSTGRRPSSSGTCGFCSWTFSSPRVSLRSCQSSAPPELAGSPDELVHRAVVDRVLVEPELWVLLDLARRWVLAGLQVDDDHPPGIVDLEPVGVPISRTRWPSGSVTSARMSCSVASTVRAFGGCARSRTG